IPVMKGKGFTVYGTELNEEAHALDKVEKTEDFAIIMGNEGQGVSQEILSSTDQNVYIPMKGNAESLNVGVAAGIVLYHFSL
ncbi:RNA methyltransferase, partial [Enterococcus faecium]